MDCKGCVDRKSTRRVRCGGAMKGKKRQENKNLVMVRSEVVTSVVFVDAAGSETSVHSSAVHFLSPTTLSG